MTGLLGKKIGMTRVIQDDGRVIPLTVVECQPNQVTQVKTTEKDGYPAIILGFSELKNPTKNKKYRFRREFRIPEEEKENFKVGDPVDVKIFEANETVSVTAISKGKGFQGVIKRHNFHRGPETHGSHHHREPGAIGACASPSRVPKGKKLPGRMGLDTVTLKKAQIAYLDPEHHLVGIKGPIPGAKNNLVIIRKVTSPKKA